MATKVPGQCPKCGHSQMPNDIHLPWKGEVLWIWHYDCIQCGWVWVNELQRLHNQYELDKAARRIDRRGMGLNPDSMYP